MSGQSDLLKAPGYKTKDDPRTCERTQSWTEGPRSPVFDPEVFEELCDLLGATQTRVRLEELVGNLEAAFPVRPSGELERDQVFQSAHALVARAGFIGFIELRDACSALQEACAQGLEIESTYDRARTAAATASQEARRRLKRTW